MLHKRRSPAVLRPWLLAVSVIACALASPAAPGILVTNLPAYGTYGDLSGIVSGVSPASWRVAVFIHVPGYGWVTKPTCAQPLTVIQGNATWTADITTGGNDHLATRIAALLVSTNYNQPCVEGLSFPPTNVLAQAAASVIVDRPDPTVRSIHFSGYDWRVKTSTGLVGPGPNYFSDNTNNVWLDAQGRLHLRITNRSNQWQCAEVVTARTFGYGHYRFELDSRVDNLNPSVVLGLFTWSDDPAFAHREIDIECSRWGNAADTNNAQFVVQPFDTPGHLVRFSVPVGTTHSTHYFTWETNRVSYQSLRGGYTPNPDPTNVIRAWTYTLAVPQTGDENVRLNLWLFNGSPPTDALETEVVIKSFEFVPLGPAQAASLQSPDRQPDGRFSFTIHGQADRRYLVQSSTNLIEWQDLATMLATNGAVEFLDAGSVGGDQGFYRTLTLP